MRFSNYPCIIATSVTIVGKFVRKTIGPVSVIMQLGAIVTVATLLPLGLGLWLDTQLGTTPWLTLVALVVGVLAAVTVVYRVISRQYNQLG